MEKPIIESRYSKENLKFLLITIIVLTAILGFILYGVFFTSKYLEMDFLPFALMLSPLLILSIYHYCTSFLKIAIYNDRMVVHNQLTGRKRSIAFSEIRGYSFCNISNTDLSNAKQINFFLKDKSIYIGAFAYENFELFIEPVISMLKNYTEEDIQKLKKRYWLKIVFVLSFFIVYGYGLVQFWDWTTEYSMLDKKEYVSIPITLTEAPYYSDPDGEPPHISLPNDEFPDFDVRIENGLSSTNMDALTNKKTGEHLLLHLPKRTYEIKVKGTRQGSFGEKNYRWNIIDVAGVRDEKTIYLDAETFAMEYRPNRPDLMIIFLLTVSLLTLASFYLIYQRSFFIKR